VTNFEPGENFKQRTQQPGRDSDQPHIWRTLGYQRTVWEPGRQVVEWKATEDYAFPSASGPIIHGGMVATILDTAMGGATWTLLNTNETFLTSNLSTEFYRSTRPGLLRAEGRVMRRTKRAVFCSADLYDDSDRHLASARCTQIILPARGPAGRPFKGEDPQEEA
jgi:uncharacterized protein (TIGR00369 family)